MKLFFIIAVGITSLSAGVLKLTICSSTKNMQHIYGIQNVKTGKGLRPYNAYWWVGSPLILHDFKNWKCMTWQFTQNADSTFQLRNLSSGKTFEASPVSGNDIGLRQQKLKNTIRQHWEFIGQADSTFLIRQKATDLYLTVSSSETNSSILLMPKSNNADQLWRLIEQHPSQ